MEVSFNGSLLKEASAEIRYEPTLLFIEAFPRIQHTLRDKFPQWDLREGVLHMQNAGNFISALVSNTATGLSMANVTNKALFRQHASQLFGITARSLELNKLSRRS